ncbi:MAG TPA: hypothetical protein VLL31_04645, partial [Sulfurovum sp.]|nr:hypothetical protein [Sulfurovum sp.]
AKNGRYVREYHSSFYGFANDKEGHKYTFGVLVIRAKKPYKYFAAQSAVPTFRRVVDILVELDYLKPEGGVEINLPEIKIDKPATLPEETKVMVKEAPKKEIVKAVREEVVRRPAPSVKELFKMKPTPRPAPTPLKATLPKPQPKEKKVVKERFEDVF